MEMTSPNFMIGFTHQNIGGDKLNPCLSIFLGALDFHITLIPFQNTLHGDTRWSWGYLYRKYRSKTIVIKNVNPFPYWIHRTKWKFIEWKLKREDKGHLICQGCGEGIVKWRIKDPNKPEFSTLTRWFNCCEGCVHFYDWYWSQKKIVRWKTDKKGRKRAVCCAPEIEVKRFKK